jgi:hypothetical protein
LEFIWNLGFGAWNLTHFMCGREVGTHAEQGSEKGAERHCGTG